VAGVKNQGRRLASRTGRASVEALARTDTKALAGATRRAFARVPEPSDMSPVSPWLRDARWQDVPAWVPRENPNAILELSADALTQYLPLWLLAAFTDWGAESPVFRAVMDVLAPEDFSSEPLTRDAWGERMALLARAQRDVVAAFLLRVRLDPTLHAWFARVSVVVRALPRLAFLRQSRWGPFCAVKRTDGTTIVSATGISDLRHLLHDAIHDGVDVSNAHLASLDLAAAPFDLAVLNGASLESAKLRSAHFAGAQLQRCNLRGADLRGAAMFGCDLSGADLSGADLRGTDLRKCKATGGLFVDADLRDADLSRADLDEACFAGARLTRARLRDAKLSNADLRSATLRGADLRRAWMIGIHIADADVRGARFQGTVAIGAEPADEAVLLPYRGQLAREP
jgi:hypothetical protein